MALAGRPGAELGGFEFAEQVLHARTIVPKQDRLLRQLAEEPAGLLHSRRFAPSMPTTICLRYFTFFSSRAMSRSALVPSSRT